MDNPARDESSPGGRRYPVRAFELFHSNSLLNTPRSSDFENKFVCGEIMSYDDLKEYGSEAAVKAVCSYMILHNSSPLIRPILPGRQVKAAREALREYVNLFLSLYQFSIQQN